MTTVKPNAADIKGAFEVFRAQAWPIEYCAKLYLHNILGGTPSDEHVGESFIKTKLAGSDDLIQEIVAQLMDERGITAEQAVRDADKLKHLNGFRRDENGLFIEGRQVKAALKEAASVAYAAGKLLNQGKNSWGRTAKGIHGFFAEHICVMDEHIPLGRTEPDVVLQKFVHTFRGDGIQYEECVSGAEIEFRVTTDYEFTEEQWAMILLTGEQQGIGASRSQGYGRYTVTAWDRLR